MSGDRGFSQCGNNGDDAIPITVATGNGDGSECGDSGGERRRCAQWVQQPRCINSAGSCRARYIVDDG